MRLPLPRPVILAIVASAWLAGTAFAEPTVPAATLNPKTAPEAWNIIRLATRNIEQLIEEDRLSEIPVQASFCSPSLRTLTRLATSAESIGKVEPLTARAISWLGAIARTAQQNNPAGTKEGFAILATQLAELRREFDPKTVEADIHFCPKHPDALSEHPMKPCAKCGARTIIRRIPYSFIYMKPRVPTIRLTATANAPLKAGSEVEVRLRMEKADKVPVTDDDLVIARTKPVHLLIEDPSLGDCQLVHPKRTGTPGEYAFSFTPVKAGPYRIWADLIPADTGTQELPFVDLPSQGTSEGVADTATRYTASAGGYQFILAMAQGNHIPVQARQARGMRISVSSSDGKPFTQLEPIRGSFAHVVGFYSDFQTIIQPHATGGDAPDQTARGGPTLGFVLFPPKAGFIRLYCQVLAGGKTVCVPFNVNVEP